MPKGGISNAHTFMFSFSKQPSFRAHQPPCHLLNELGTRFCLCWHKPASAFQAEQLRRGSVVTPGNWQQGCAGAEQWVAQSWKGFATANLISHFCTIYRSSFPPVNLLYVGDVTWLPSTQQDWEECSAPDHTLPTAIKPEPS